MHILKRWPPAKIRILLLLLLAVGMLLYECWLLALLLRTPSDQIGIYYGENIIVKQVPQGSALQVDDVILKIGPLETNDGLLVPGYWHTRLFDSGTGTGATYVVRRGTDILELDIPWQKVSLNDLLWRGGALWAIPLTTFVIACLVLSGRGQERGARLLALFFTFLAYLQLNNLFPVSSANLALTWGWLFIPLDLLAVWLSVSTYLHTFLVFPEVKSVLLRFSRLPIIIYTAIPVLSIITALVSSRTTILGVRDAVFLVLNPLAILIIIAGLVALGHTYRTSHNPGTRNQILWIVWGLGLGILPWIVFYAIPSTFLGKPWLPLTVTNLTSLILPVVFMVAIFRYGLLDIEFIINRTLVYCVAVGMLVAVYMATVSSARAVILQITGTHNDYLAGIAGALVVFVVYNPLRLYVEQGIARTLYRDHLDFQAVLHEISETLSTTILLSDVLNLLTYQIADRLGLVHATLVLLDNGDQKTYTVDAAFQGTVGRDVIGWLYENNMPLLVNDARQLPEKVVTAAATLGQNGVEVCLPLRHHNELLGLYLFGHKQSGALLSRQDIDILVLLSHQAAAALQNAQLYRELQTYNRELEVRVQERAADLLAERNRLDTIVQNISDGLVVTDLAGKIVLFNPAFEQILGINRKQIQGFAFSEVVDSEVLEKLIAVSLTHPGEVFTDYFTTMLKQGRNTVSYVYKTSACALVQHHKPAPSLSPDINLDNIQGVVTVLRDVTHEYEVDRMKTEFISTVSHELRTPLTSVLGFAKLIHKLVDRDIVTRISESDRRGQRSLKRIVDNLDIIISEGNRLTRLINDVLDVAKMESGKIEWHMVDINIAEVIQRAVSATAALAAEKNLSVEVVLPQELPSVYADQDRLIQVITNLLSNAIKFTEDGYIQVRAFLTQVLPDATVDPYIPGLGRDVLHQLAVGDWLAVSVRDTGIGISCDRLSGVFEKFKQVADSSLLSGLPRGTGLGLPICKEIIEQHGGRIGVDSHPGVGSTFSFILPLKSTFEIQKGLPFQPSSQEIATVHNSNSGVQLPKESLRQKPLILIIEDEENIMSLLRQVLTGAGYQVAEVANGSQAVTKARELHPDLVLSDVMIPGISGFDVLRVLKSDPETRLIPVVILSVIGEHQQRDLHLEANAYLDKPVDVENLLQTVADLLSRGENKSQ